ncbi:MAG: dipeptidase [Gammaproteobacteria bacterium]
MPEYESMHRPATIFDFGLDPQQERRAKALHDDIFVFDALMECTWYESYVGLSKQGGLNGGNISLGVAEFEGFLHNNDLPTDLWWSWDALANDLTGLTKIVQGRDDEMAICLSAQDLRDAKNAGKLGMMPGVQNTQFIERDISRIGKAYDMGLRIVLLTYNRINYVGSGCMEDPEDQFGLSRFGEEVVGALNDANMLVDTGHCSSPTLMAAVEVSQKPIACSHSGLRGVIDQPRSHTDEALKKLADNGGVFGVISTPGALVGKSRCTVNDYLDNIDYAINLIGVEHVGIGTDFVMASSVEQILSMPDWGDAERKAVGVSVDVWPWSDGHEGMENSSGFPNLTRGLVARGYSDDDIAKIMGGNWLRLIEETIG